MFVVHSKCPGPLCVSITACAEVLFVVSPINLGQRVVVNDTVCCDVGFVDRAERPVQGSTCTAWRCVARSTI